MPANDLLNPPAEAQAARILLVEDDVADAYLLRRLIEAEGGGEFVPVEADRLATALERIEEGGIRCILLDLHLPDSTGLATFREISRHAAEVPIVVLSGLDDRRVAVQAVREGAQDYLVKSSVDGLLLVRSMRYAIERHQTREHWRHLSLEDDLTRLYNRRGLLALGDQQVKLARRRKTPLTVLFLDLDGLKEINDTLGHELGDRALLEAADALRASFRESDVLARLSGDEFVVLLEGVDRAGFGILEARLEESLEAVNRSPARPFRLEMSWGTAVFDPRVSSEDCTLEELVKRADLAMYETKRAKKAAHSSRETLTRHA